MPRKSTAAPASPPKGKPRRKSPEPAEKSPRSATFYLSDAAGPPLKEAEVSADRAAWRISASAAEELAGRRGGSAAKWNWPLFERAFVDGVEAADGKRRWPSTAELAEWSGADKEVVKNRASRDEWYRKRKIHEERLPSLVDSAVKEHLADRLGDYLAAADEAVAQRSARQWLRAIGEPYLQELEKRVRGVSEHGRITINATDGERLLRLMLAAEGEATERVAIVGAVQINLNLQRDATVSAIQECAARGLISEDLVPAILETLQIHVSRVRWRFRVDAAELAEISAPEPAEEPAPEPAR